MILPGQLRSTTLGDVLGALHRARISGELELISNEPPYLGHHHFISIRDGLVAEVKTPMPVPRLGEVLLEQGDLSASQHKEFVARLWKQPTQQAGEVLVQYGFTTSAQIVAGLNRQNRLRLDALFQLRDAALRFHPMVRPSHCTRLPPAEFLYGRQRSRDAHKSQRKSTVPQHGPFETLGLHPNAPTSEVRRAFRRLASSAHPDLHTHLPPDQRRALETRFADLTHAYHEIITQRALSAA